jgi:hypothetical protein
MSIGSLGIVGGLAGSPLSQRASEIERAEREAADRAGESKANERAEQAAGIGQTAEDSEAQERDADGRRPWEHPAAKKPAVATSTQPTAADPPPTLAKDPTGQCGGELDLVG